MMHDFLANNRQDLSEWCRPGFHMFVRTLDIRVENCALDALA